jgi:hypothetical protein
MLRGSAIALSLCIGTAWIAGPMGCQPKEHLIVGQLYEPAQGCVDPSSGIATTDGEPTFTSCTPTCLVEPVGQNGSEQGIFITTDCGPFPAIDDTSGTIQGCDQALAAFNAGTICASEDAGAGDDASEDVMSSPIDAGSDAIATPGM